VEFKGTKYVSALYYAKYLFTLVFCLPAKRITTSAGVSMDKPAVNTKGLFDAHVKLIVKWHGTNTMMTKDEMMDFINTKREEQKNAILSQYNVLSDEDVQLMKDMKMIGFKMAKAAQNGENEAQGVGSDADADADAALEEEGVAEHAMSTENPDEMNADTL
jgi:hypothetical protein